MLARNILAIITFVVATVATPVTDLEKRNKCGTSQNLECCESIFNGIGVNCVAGMTTPSANQIRSLMAC
jgi:hypothetical protein